MMVHDGGVIYAFIVVAEASVGHWSLILCRKIGLPLYYLSAYPEMGMKIKYLSLNHVTGIIKIEQNSGKCLTSFGNETYFVWE